MNEMMGRLTREIGLGDSKNARLRLAFGHACVDRITQLVEEDELMNCLHVLGDYVQGKVDETTFRQARLDADHLTNPQRCQKPIDGCGHAAVSASYTVANAINGKALQAASYAASASVYASGGVSAVAQREAFEAEFRWQLNALQELASTASVNATVNANA